MAVVWTQVRSDLSGSRWAVWEKYYREVVPWGEFKEKSAQFNQNLNRSSGWCFILGRQYHMPMVTGDERPAQKRMITTVPYASQLENEWTGKYFGSDSDSNDDTPDGCWKTDDRPNGGYGKGAQGCFGPWINHREPTGKGCIRPGSCNVTSLWMMLQYHGATNLDRHRETLLDGMQDSEDARCLKKNTLSPSWLYVYMMACFGDGKQHWRVPGDPRTACNSRVVARADYLADTANVLIAAQELDLEATYIMGPIEFHDYRSCIDDGYPVVINSARMGHVVCGIGYEINDGHSVAIVHDPYGRKDQSVRKWQKYNRCGEPDNHGEAVPYDFSKLSLRYLLWIKSI